jgi:nicotinate-nucleotide adenylyltransferase
MGKHARGQKIGIFGGTFDPVHYGHLISAESIRSDFNLDKVFFVPSNYTVKKESTVIAPGEDRYAMAVLATGGINEFEVSRIELDRAGPSYTITTVEKFRELYPESCLYLIIGLDALGCVRNWRDSKRLMELVPLIVMRRPGLKQITAYDPCPYNTRYAENPPVGISSSLIRNRLQEGKSIRFLAPDPVIEYIQTRKLYA